MWAATQLVRSWLRLRIVAGVCLGLLLIYVAHGLLHEFVDVPDNIKYWQEHRAEELRRRNWPENSFMATQLEKQLTGGAMIGVDGVLAIFAAAIGHGLAHGTLPSASLAFRWNYWIGSMRIFRTHPLLGVGWNNFGPSYLAVRAIEASEEIKDPHNFIVRILV